MNHDKSAVRTARVSTAIALATLGTFLWVGATTASATPSQDTTTSTTPETTTTTTIVAPAPTTTVAPAPAPTPTALPLTGEVLSEKSTGAEVFLMQIRLTERGYWLSDSPGFFGASTRHGLTAFQKFMGLPRSGKLDAATRFVLGATRDRATPMSNKSGRYVEVDLGRQVLIVSENNAVLWVFDISSGKKSTPTPRGTFRVQRQINGQRISKLGQLWRPKYFTGGYALHGSPSVPTTAASHGCVRMTNQEINFIWDVNLIPIGTPITLS